MLKNQLFGVEVEMTGITREKAARTLPMFLEPHLLDQNPVVTTHAQSLIRRLANGKL